MTIIHAGDVNILTDESMNPEQELCRTKAFMTRTKPQHMFSRDPDKSTSFYDYTWAKGAWRIFFISLPILIWGPYVCSWGPKTAIRNVSIWAHRGRQMGLPMSASMPRSSVAAKCMGPFAPDYYVDSMTSREKLRALTTGLWTPFRVQWRTPVRLTGQEHILKRGYTRTALWFYGTTAATITRRMPPTWHQGTDSRR